MNSKLRDILAAVYLAGIENGLGGRIVDPEEIVHRREAFVKGNPAATEAEKTIRQAVGEEMLEIVGSDQNTHWGACNNHGDKSNFKCVCPVEDRNALRAELRQKIKEWSQS